MNHNMLVDYLPETVEIEGTEYAIETNFRTFILFEMMMQDPDLSDAEKARQGLELVYPEIPENLDAAVDGLLWFYAGGKRWREKRAGAVEGTTGVQRIYSFEHDDDYIYSAFLTQYHIDLQPCKYFTAADMQKIVDRAMFYVSYNTTYCNAVNMWIKSAEKASDLEQIQWGAEIPEEFQNEVLKDYMKILASGGIS